MDMVRKIMDFESGQMGQTATIDFFAELIKSELAWKLQGSYGRTAAGLIEGGLISVDGEVLAYDLEDVS